MLILAIDSAGSGCGVAVWRNGEKRAHCFEVMQRGQDVRLMPMVQEALAKDLTGFADFDRIAVTRGPGSFTGLRVGLAAARGIGLAAGKPVIGIDRFSIYRAATPHDRDILVIIDSRRAELFCRYYPSGAEPHEPCLMTQAQIDHFCVTHPDIWVAGDVATPEVDTVTWCAALAATAIPGLADTLARPLYLRAPDVSLPGAAANSR